MVFDFEHYTKRIDAVMLKAGAVSEVYCEVDGYRCLGYDLMRENRPVVYLSTGIHGDEPGGPEALLHLLENGLLERNLSFHICPMLNPTGFERGARENSRGRDMNRDYYHMHNIEVEGHVKWLEARKPELFISLHEDWESEGFYYYEINISGDDPERYDYLAGKVSEVMTLETAEVIDGHQVRRRGWIYHEVEADLMECWPEAIYMAKLGCALSFTFESPSSLDMKQRVAVHTRAVNSLLNFMYGEFRF